MGKLIEEGDFEFEGTKVHYRFYRDGRLSDGSYDCYLECDYGGQIIEHDKGRGLAFAIKSAKVEINIRKQKAEKVEKKTTE